MDARSQEEVGPREKRCSADKEVKTKRVVPHGKVKLRVRVAVEDES